MIAYTLRLGIGFINADQECEITVEEMGYTDEEWNELREDVLQSEWTRKR